MHWKCISNLFPSQIKSLFAVPVIDHCFPSLLPVRIFPDDEEPASSRENQSESTQSDSDDCVVHGPAVGRQVSDTEQNRKQTMSELVVIVQRECLWLWKTHTTCLDRVVPVGLDLVLWIRSRLFLNPALNLFVRKNQELPDLL